MSEPMRLSTGLFQFVAGLVAGPIILLAAGLAVASVVVGVRSDLPFDPGAAPDSPRSGIASYEVKQAGKVLQVRCRGACDAILDNRSLAVRRIRALDAGGQVVEEQGRFGDRAKVSGWLVSNDWELSIWGPGK